MNNDLRDVYLPIMHTEDDRYEPGSLALASTLINAGTRQPSSSSSSLSSVPEGFDGQTEYTNAAIADHEAADALNANAGEEVDDQSAVDDGAEANDTKESNDEERIDNNANDQRSSVPSGSAVAAASSQKAEASYDSGLNGEADLTDNSVVGNPTQPVRQTAAEAESATANQESTTDQPQDPRNSPADVIVSCDRPGATCQGHFRCQ